MQLKKIHEKISFTRLEPAAFKEKTVDTLLEYREQLNTLIALTADYSSEMEDLKTKINTIHAENVQLKRCIQNLQSQNLQSQNIRAQHDNKAK